ncbi:hypothetical protein JTB14_001579 [Gonioctena quinquepunctata]|nr:hypothetical protein JTB14_001579 [Gonioctena quinquepunctata]
MFHEYGTKGSPARQSVHTPLRLRSPEVARYPGHRLRHSFLPLCHASPRRDGVTPWDWSSHSRLPRPCPPLGLVTQSRAGLLELPGSTTRR